MPLRNAPSATLAKLTNIGERLTRRVLALDTESPDVNLLQQRVTAAVSDHACVTIFEIRPKALQWLETGIDLERGEVVTLIGTGALHLMRALKVSLLPKSVIWWRVGEAPIHSAPGESWTFTADADGPASACGLS